MACDCRAKKRNHATVLTRVYAPKKIANWWQSLTTEQRGEALALLIKLKPKLINTTPTDQPTTDTQNS
jgi:hypothetical protein